MRLEPVPEGVCELEQCDFVRSELGAVTERRNSDSEHKRSRVPPQAPPPASQLPVDGWVPYRRCQYVASVCHLSGVYLLPYHQYH